MPPQKRFNSERFPWGEFLKKLAAIAIPIALQNLLTTTGSMVDTMMVAPLGEKTVGALGLCAQFSSLMFAGYWGFVGGGMIPKLKNCIDAIEHGVNRVHILDGRIPHSLLLEIFTNKGIGTAILKDDGEKYYNEHE